MPTAEFEPATPASEWPHTVWAATGSAIDIVRQIMAARNTHRHTRRETAVLAPLITKPKGITGNYKIRNDSLNIVLVMVDSLQH